MQPSKPTSLIVAVRVYPEPKNADLSFDKPRRKWSLPDAALVFDTETSTDQRQYLKFGSYRFVVGGRCLKEGLFYADQLTTTERQVLERYVATPHRAEVVDEGLSELLLLPRSGFVKELYRDAYKARCLLVGFNLPFDLSRVACDFTKAEGRFAGGFSLGLWSYIDKQGNERRHPFRPRIGIKHIDSKRALKGFTGRKITDESDLIPEGSNTGKPEEDYIFRGHFLDLRTLAFALTDQGYTLEGACEAFGVENGKKPTFQHGIVTDDYIRYNRDDVQATSELAIKLLEEYSQHPIDLQATKAYSPASIGKAYLRAMGINPILERQPKFPKRYLGYAQSAFYGGRTSSHIRKVAVPVVYTDFRSMYPTVNSLMNLWRFVTAGEIKVVPDCGAEVEAFLGQLKPDSLFDPAVWRQLTAFVQIVPNGDILPARGRYNIQTNDWQVGLNHLYAADEDANHALWFSLPDVVASVILNGEVPKIVNAFRIEANGRIAGLKPTKLRGMIEVDPAQQDFFRVVVEERQRLSTRTDLSVVEKDRLNKALKVLANAASYGIYAEMHRLESDDKVKTTCYGIDPEPFAPTVAHPDEPGAYCFPPLASLITGAARLMLALLEHEVFKLNGSYAMEDTDSMAIVATEQGGSVACAGGEGGSVNALSWAQVEEISKRFLSLNPYDRSAVPRSILKIESDNRDPITEKPRQLYCLAISAKRYALFLLDSKGEPTLLRGSCPFCGRKNKPQVSQCVNKKCGKPIHLNNEDDRWSEHGLGHLLNPIDPENEDREWIAQAWLRIIRRSLDLPSPDLGFESSPAVGTITVSSPARVKPLAKLNRGKPCWKQVKPFNFLLTCHVKPLGHPPGVKPERFHLIAPYETDSRQWLKKSWIDQYSEKQFRITTTGPHGDRQTARVKTYGDVLVEYEYHPESKCADANGNICSKQTIGLLQRRHVRIDQVKYIGKESNSLEEVDSGTIHSAQDVYTEYVDPRRDEWQTKIVPALRDIKLPILEKESGLSRRMLIKARNGHVRPHRKNRDKLSEILHKLGAI